MHFIKIHEAGLVETDGRARTLAARRRMPACCHEFIGCFCQILCGTLQPFHIAEHNDSVPGEQRIYRHHVIDKRRDQRFHPFYGHSPRNRFQHVIRIRDRTGQRFRPAAHTLRQLQFPAGRRPYLAYIFAECALI